MAGTSSQASAPVRVKVELFGVSRLAVGRREVELLIPPGAGYTYLARALAEACPELVGSAVRSDLLGLQDGYVFNLNGTEFVGSQRLSPKSGDCLLLISNQAGG